MAKKKQNKLKSVADMTYGEFMLFFPMCTEEVQLEALFYLAHVDCPTKLGDKEVSTTLDRITYGQLDDLHDASKSDDIVSDIIKILVGELPELNELPVTQVYGYINMVERELLRINKIFNSLEHKYSKEEIAAGVENLSFGSFGVLDWYARRMGIANQNDVRDIPWVRIFQCMKNDNQQQLYERRLNAQYTKGSKKH